MLRICLDRGRKFGKETLVADIAELENMNASEVHARRLKRGINATEGESLYSQSRKDTHNCLEEIMGSENPLQSGINW